MKHMKNEKGLTLIELLAVIVILAIIAAIAIPAIGNIINNQRDKAILAEVSGIISAAKIANADGACSSNVCTYTTATTGNQVAFTSSKVTAATISFSGTNASNPLVTSITLAGYTSAGAPFQGSKASTYHTIVTKAVGASAAGFAESELNEAMGN